MRKLSALVSIGPAVLALCLLAIVGQPSTASAQITYGTLDNFDVINDTGHTAHGFEIELEGLHASDITDTFGGDGRGFPSGRGFDPNTAVQRYGAPTVSDAFVDETHRAPGFMTADIRMSKELWPRTELYLGVLNSFDMKQEPGRVGDFRPPLGRMMYVGVRGEWPEGEKEPK